MWPAGWMAVRGALKVTAVVACGHALMSIPSLGIRRRDDRHKRRAVA
jgi:hypothetical protein